MGCDCGTEYIRAGVFAARVIADPANAEKSDRAIAAEIGVGLGTVQRARAKSTDPNESVETPPKRTGRDGKKRAQPKKKKKDEVRLVTPKALPADKDKYPLAASYKPSRKYPQMVRVNEQVIFPPDCREELIKKLMPIIKGLHHQGRSVPAVTLLPSIIESLANDLEILLDEWCTAP